MGSAVVDIERALIKFLEDEQPFTPKLHVVGPLQSYAPGDRETYLRTSMFPNPTNTRSTAKGGPVQYTGIFQVLVLGPATGSSFELKEIAGVIAEELFAKDVPIRSEQGEKIKVPREAWVSPMINDSVKPAIPVSVPFSMVRIK